MEVGFRVSPSMMDWQIFAIALPVFVAAGMVKGLIGIGLPTLAGLCCPASNPESPDATLSCPCIREGYWRTYWLLRAEGGLNIRDSNKQVY